MKCQPQHTGRFALDAAFLTARSRACASQQVSFLRHRGRPAETSPALTLSDFAHTPKVPDRSFRPALQWIGKQQLLHILNSKDIKLRLSLLLQKVSNVFPP